MLWKEMFAASVTKKRSGWALRIGATLLVIAIALPLVTSLTTGFLGPRVSYRNYMEMATVMACTTGSILILLAGSRAAGLVTHERERDTWLSLLTTPQQASEIVTAKTAGNLYAFRWQLLGVCSIPLLGVVLSPIATLAALGTVLVVIIGAWAATAIGLAVSLRMKNSVKAVGTTVFILLAIGAFYSPLAAAFAALTGLSEEGFALFVFTPLVPLLVAMPMMFSTGDSFPDWFPVVFCLGVGLYLFVAFAVTWSNAAMFDRLCERGSSSSASTSPRSPREAPLVNSGEHPS